MNAANDIIQELGNFQNHKSFSEANLENANSLALSTVQTTLTRQASNGC